MRTGNADSGREDYWHLGFKVQTQVTCPSLNSDINVVQDAIVYHKRDVNEYINYRLLDVMWEE